MIKIILLFAAIALILTFQSYIKYKKQLCMYKKAYDLSILANKKLLVI